ncbi:MAG: T9SS type A sorting domain-containing protein [Candidatus Kapaibacterium sp.]|jgi:hypothetical protein
MTVFKTCVFLIFFLYLLSGGDAIAQPPAALDPDCYLPRIGVAGEIDSIYGSVRYQRLGNNLKGIGPAPGEARNRITFGGIAPFPDSSFDPLTNADVFQGGPNFRLNGLQSLGKIKGVDVFRCQFAHFRSQRLLDAIWNRRIYWSDEQGMYDSARSTLVRGGVRGDFLLYQASSAILTKLTHDSIDDLIMMWDSIPPRLFTAYACWYDGQKLFGKDTAWADSTRLFEEQGQGRYCLTADFTGTGRQSVIGDDSSRNLFFYENVAPFSLEGFCNAMKFDTLLAIHDNPRIKDGSYGYALYQALAMRAFPKAPWDHSVDFLTPQRDNTDTLHYRPPHVYFFKGGPEFGKRRLLLDSAEFVMRTPEELEFPAHSFFGLSALNDCGDMTGTGNKVLLLQETDDGFTALNYFYVTGRALDDRADMFYEVDPDGLGIADTLTADANGLQDVIIGMQNYYSYEDHSIGKTEVGTVHVIHGSSRIPVKISPKFDVGRAPGSADWLQVYPNPSSSRVSISLREFENQEISISIRDILGREVFASHHRCPKEAEIYSIKVSMLAQGSYVLTIESGHLRRSSSIAIIH